MVDDDIDDEKCWSKQEMKRIKERIAKHAVRTDKECDDDDEDDPVNNPSHYCNGGVECIDAIKGSFEDAAGFRGFLKGNIMKYVFRYEQKNGLEDLHKAKWYLDRLIAELER